MRQVQVVGIGAGDPDDITVKAVTALNRADVLFLPAKGEDGGDLLRARYDLLDRYLDDGAPRIVEIEDPKRDFAAPPYGDAVQRWYDQRMAAWEEALRAHLADGQVGAFLAWGDPALYDGTLRILDGIRDRGAVEFEVEVIPGISAIQSLTARHGITLNQVGGSVLITTGRELAARWSDDVDDAVVMLDPHCTFGTLPDRSIAIYWGAYLGTPDEILISGTIEECAATIERARAEAKDRHGWVFDTYLLRRDRRR